MSKCIILVTNFQKSQALGGSPPPAPLNLRWWWSEVAYWAKFSLSNWLWQNWT